MARFDPHSQRSAPISARDQGLGIFLSAGVTVLATLVMIALTSQFGGGFSSGIARDSLSDRWSLPIIIHLIAVIPAIPLGGFVLLRRKGDALHKFCGRLWAMMMMIAAISSFWIGRPGGGLMGSGLSFIHIFSIITLISIPLAIWQVRRGNIEAHRRAMRGPYIGLIIAGLFAFVPGRIMGVLVFG
jgi:uncharacterized membrane protein